MSSPSVWSPWWPWAGASTTAARSAGQTSACCSCSSSCFSAADWLGERSSNAMLNARLARAEGAPASGAWTCACGWGVPYRWIAYFLNQRRLQYLCTGALLFEIEGPACCAEEKGPAFWAEEMAMMVVPFFWLGGLFLVMISYYIFHFWLDLFMAHFLLHRGCIKRSARVLLFRGR